jgi:hypothetical protein
MADTRRVVDRVEVFQCIGCGKIEAPQPCIGVCRDRRTQLVYAEDYDALVAEAEALRAILRQIATITPREGECLRSWQALQTRARAALGLERRGGATLVTGKDDEQH